MPFLKPSDVVITTISMPRWQKQWIKSHYTVNFSGLVQDVLVNMIKEKDPCYFEDHKHLLDEKPTRRKDVIETMVNPRAKLVI